MKKYLLILLLVIMTQTTYSKNMDEFLVTYPKVFQFGRDTTSIAYYEQLLIYYYLLQAPTADYNPNTPSIPPSDAEISCFNNFDNSKLNNELQSQLLTQLSSQELQDFEHFFESAVGNKWLNATHNLADAIKKDNDDELQQINIVKPNYSASEDKQSQAFIQQHKHLFDVINQTFTSKQSLQQYKAYIESCRQPFATQPSISNNDTKITQWEKDADIAYYFQPKQARMAKAIYDENVEEIKRLVQKEGYNVNTRDRVGADGWTRQYTFLNYAVIKQKLKSAKTLLELGADVNQLMFNGSGHSNLNLAAQNGDKAMINLLLDHHIQMDHTIVESPLSDYITNSGFDKSVLDAFIKHGADVNHPEYVSGDTPLMTAYAILNHQALDYLLAKGANPLQLELNGHNLATIIQRDLTDNKRIKSANKYKQRLIHEYHVSFPMDVNYRQGIIEGIKRYDKTTAEERALLGSDEARRIQEMRESLKTGIYDGVAIDAK